MKTRGRVRSGVISALLSVSVLIPGTCFPAGADEAIPPLELTGGGRAGDSVTEGFGDILAPVFLLESGLVFVNPRASYTDDSAEEYNLGVGYRHLLAPRNLILGANVYYDHRETSLDSRFNQVGFGIEMLGEWVDARANYYLPEDDRETVNEYDVETVSRSTSYRSSEWGAPYATGNEIVQDGLVYKSVTTTTTKQHFEQFEQAMEGWDCEMGVRLPIPVVMDCADVKLFGGYYLFNADFGDDDVRGFKGRLEIKALPAVYLDAEVYEDKELAGSDFFFGARMSVPFDVANISKGRNPFEGAADGFVPSGNRAPFASRLTEMVMRDLHVRTEVSDVVEDVGKREVTTASRTEAEPARNTLVGNANFVDGDNDTGVENGTAEHPYNTINEGVSNAVGSAVIYVYDAAAVYAENVVLGDGQTVWGSGCVMLGEFGMTFGNGIYPVVDGRSRGPTFTLANNTTLRGLEIINTEDAGQPSLPFFRAEWGVVETRRVGVFGDNVSPVTLQCLHVNSVQYGALLCKDGSFEAALENNDFSGADLSGVMIAGRGASGTFLVEGRGNTFSDNGGFGLYVVAANYDSAVVDLADSAASDNGIDGMRMAVDNKGPVTINIDQLTATDNGGDGLWIHAYSSTHAAPVTVTVADAVLNDNDAAGVEVYAGSTGDTGDVWVSFADVEALRNFGHGIYVSAISSGEQSPIRIFASNVDASDQIAGAGINTLALVNGSGDMAMIFDQVDASSNGSSGVWADARMNGSQGSVVVDFSDVSANGNAADGFFVNADTAYGASTVSFYDGIEANGNGGNGIRVLAVEGNLADGMAFAVFDDVDANDNTGSGIWIGNVYCNDGDAFAAFNNVSASGNDGSGIRVDQVEGTGVGASTMVRVSDVEANGNGADGLYFADVCGGAGEALFVGTNVSASGNGGCGVRIQQVQAHGVDAVAGVFMANVTADVNGVHGIYASASSQNGPAQAEFSHISASGNHSNGIFLASLMAHGAGAAAAAGFSAVRANANSNRGIYAYVNSSAGSASARFSDVTANGNRRDGIYVDYVEGHGATGSAEAVFTDVQANGNGGDGIASWADAYGAGGDALTTFLRTETHNNRGCGIYTEVYSEQGDAYLTGERVVSFSNRQDGVQIYTYAGSDVFADFGNGAQGSAGLCSIYSNTVFNMNNTGSDPVTAQSNWWGSATPPAGKFSGSIDRSNPLAADPNL